MTLVGKESAAEQPGVRNHKDRFSCNEAHAQCTKLLISVHWMDINLPSSIPWEAVFPGTENHMYICIKLQYLGQIL